MGMDHGERANLHFAKHSCFVYLCTRLYVAKNKQLANQLATSYISAEEHLDCGYRPQRRARQRIKTCCCIASLWHIMTQNLHVHYGNTYSYSYNSTADHSSCNNMTCFFFETLRHFPACVNNFCHPAPSYFSRDWTSPHSRNLKHFKATIIKVLQPSFIKPTQLKNYHSVNIRTHSTSLSRTVLLIVTYTRQITV